LIHIITILQKKGNCIMVEHDKTKIENMISYG